MDELKKLILLFGLILLISGCQKEEPSNDQSAQSEAPKPPVEQKSEEEQVDDTSEYYFYEFVKEGMSYEEVSAKLGEGEKKVEMESFGIKAEQYDWTYDNVVFGVTFHDGIVESKNMYSLDFKPSPGNVTSEKVSQISEGMEYEEVIGILGEGLEIGRGFSSPGTTTYIWIGPGGEEVTLIFLEDKVSMILMNTFE